MSVPVPVDVPQLAALASVSYRELRWVLPQVDREVTAWLQRARRIPDAPLREDAVTTLVNERFNIQGAALFAAMPRCRNLGLLRLLCIFQTMVDFLDTVSEHPCDDVVANGTQLHRALYEALDPGGPISDHYRFHPWQDDAGYLHAMVEACRHECSSLPSFDIVQPYALREAARLRVCAINHEPDAAVRNPALRTWVKREFDSTGDCAWYEISAAATSSVTIHALLSLAGEPRCTEREVRATRDAYFPWISLASTMLDSYADLEHDVATGAHSYVSHYPSYAFAVKRLGEIVANSMAAAIRLPRGRRHVLVPAGMAAMYLSDSRVLRGPRRGTSRQILTYGGTLSRLQLLILRAWRRLTSS